MKFLAGLVLAVVCGAQAQFEILDGKTTVGLRGIDAVSPQVAWASGSGGTVLLTKDGGANWKYCAVPPDGEKSDFRGVQGFDATTAIVMSSGKGDLSRLYKTNDGCLTWKLLLTNPDPEGFWDAVSASKTLIRPAIVVGDPVGGWFDLFTSAGGAWNHWDPLLHPDSAPYLKIPPPHSNKESLYAASNSALLGADSNSFAFVTGGSYGSFLYMPKWHIHALFDYSTASFLVVPLPMAKSPSAGAFSVAANHDCRPHPEECVFVVVGGDYRKPDDRHGTAAYSRMSRNAQTPSGFKAAQSMPHGYRSAVAYDTASKTWITAGPNGADISKDDAKNWIPLKPAANDAPDADKNWNAISLPFVVGSKGRIGKLKRDAIDR